MRANVEEKQYGVGVGDDEVVLERPEFKRTSPR